MSISDHDRKALQELVSKLTPDHLSSIAASLNVPDSLIGTAKNGPKHEFFLKLVELELAAEQPLPDDIDPEVRENVTAFSIHEAARQEVERLLSQ